MICVIKMGDKHTFETILTGIMTITGITMASYWARWCLKSPASRLFTQPFIQTQIKENVKAQRHWPLWREFIGDRWIPRTYAQKRGKCFHWMTSSCHYTSVDVSKKWPIELRLNVNHSFFFQWTGTNDSDHDLCHKDGWQIYVWHNTHRSNDNTGTK